MLSNHPYQQPNKKNKRLFELQILISITFSITAVIGIVFVGFALYIPFYNSTLNVLSADHRQVIEQVNMNLDTYLRSMMNISDTVYFQVVKNNDFLEGSINEELSLLYNLNMDRLVSIGLFSDDGEVVSAMPLTNIKPTADVKNQDWFLQAKAKTENLHFSVPHVQNVFQNVDSRYRWVVSISRYVDITYGGDPTYGVLLIDMNFSGINQICTRATLGETGYVYITGSNGEIIYHPDQQLIYSGLKTENVQTAAGYEDGGHIEDFGGRRRLVTVKTVGYTGWKIVGVSYLDELFPYQEIIIGAFMIMFFAIFIMVLLNQYISRRIVEPVKQLETAVREIEAGRMTAKIVPSGSAEMQNLGYAINGMLRRINNLMETIVLEHELKRKSELDALQSQITPHFLYNALDSAVWMIERGKKENAAIMVTAISKLFRIGISKGDNIITIRSEIEHASNYLTIQNIRFKNKFHYEITVADDVAEMQTIKLIVQPIIENAIHHGMEYLDEGEGLIKINAFAEDEDVIILISDNGSGMPPEKTVGLLKAPDKKGKGSGIGLYNVQKRIQLYYGEKYGLSIFSIPDEGTSVTIRLPKKEMPTEDRHETRGGAAD